MQKLALFFIVTLLFACSSGRITKGDKRKDVLMQTSKGDITLRLYDATPLHRDNFLKLVKSKYYDGLLFHRVIEKFMIQGGDPDSRNAPAGKPLGDGGPKYTVPAEFRPELFHRKGVLAAARESDSLNPKKESSASQFYIVQGKVWTPGGLDTLEIKRLKGRKIPPAHRAVYTTIGGTPHLDQNYTVYGEVVKGLWIVDSIAAVATSRGADKDRPLQDVKIIKARLVKRK